MCPFEIVLFWISLFRTQMPDAMKEGEPVIIILYQVSVSTSQNLRQDIYEIWYREWALGRFGKVSDLWQVQFTHSRGTISCSLRAPSSWEGSRNLETGYSFLRLRGHRYSWCAQAGVVQAAPGIHASNRFVGNALRIVTGWPFRRGWWFARICLRDIQHLWVLVCRHTCNKQNSSTPRAY
jgi:hypothetical protein